ncbi:tetratricopeptide repeat protein [Roseivirga sp. BDSF3-8]|uniref:tetratricopeptide repeat protein n=1 Tax=Roseivirga sp. BDSF3-8 TaxID=3241598 RepID=UPI003531F92F
MKKIIPVIFISLLMVGCMKDNLEEELSSSSPKNEYIIVDELLNRAKANFDTDPDKALELAQSALTQSESSFYLKGEQKSHNVLHWLYLNKFDDYTKAGNHHEAYKRVTEELKETKDLALLNYKKGYTLFKSEKLTEAVPYLFEARDLYLSQGEFQKEAYALYAISKVFDKVGKYDDALKYLNKIYFEEVDDSFLWTVYQLQGILYSNIEEYEKAQSSLKKSYTIVSVFNNPNAKIKILNALSYPAIKLGKYELADQYLSEGLKLAQHHNNTELLATLYLKKGYLLENSIGYREAIPFYEMAYTIASENGITDVQLNATLDLSNCYFHLNEYKESVTYSKKGVLLDEKGTSNIIHSLYHNLSLANKLLGDSISYYKFQSKKDQVRVKQLNNSQYVGVHKAELAYRDKVHTKEHEAYIENIHHEMAESERRYDFYTLCLIGFFVLAILVMVLYKPYRLYMDNSKKVLIRTDDLQRAFQKRLAGYSAIFPTLKEKKVPGPPDERDIHNMWDRLNKKKNKRKGGNPDDENESGKDND